MTNSHLKLSIGFPRSLLFVWCVLSSASSAEELPLMKRGYFGAVTDSLSEFDKRKMVVAVPFGIRVVSVAPNTPAEDAGFKRGDIILFLNQAPVETKDQFKKEMRQLEPEAEISLNVLRDSAENLITVTLGQLPNLKAELQRYNEFADSGATGMCRHLGLLSLEGQLLVDTPTGKHSSSIFRYLKTAAGDGDVEAKAGLGLMYLRWGTRKEQLTKGLTLLEEAQSVGALRADRYVGTCYLDGIGVEKNRTKAYRLLSKARSNGDADHFRLGECHFHGYGTVRDYQVAHKHYRIAADGGDRRAQFRLGQMYRDGLGVDKDLSESAKWFKRAAERGHVTSIVEIGNAYLFGHGVKKDPLQAMEWYHQGADKGDHTCINNLGACYAHGWGVEKDDGKAIEFFGRSARDGSGFGMYNMAAMIMDGRGHERNYKTARTWYERAVKHGYHDALVYIGDMELGGEGTPPDREKAIEYYLKARDHGVELAEERLKELTHASQ